MQVLQVEPGFALCEGMGERRTVDTGLIDTPKPGDWLLVFLDAAREKLDPDEARRIGDALQGLHLALAGHTDLDRFFPDLANREPELPDFLKPYAIQSDDGADTSRVFVTPEHPLSELSSTNRLPLEFGAGEQES